MFSIKLFNTPDINWVLNDRNCIKLFALKDIIFTGNVKKVYFDGFRYDFSNDVIGVPFKDKEVKHSALLYHPESSFRWRGAREASISLINPDTSNHLTIPQGSLLCKINLMSIQFFNLMSRHDNSDKGLRSTQIKIELINENN